MKQCKLIVDGKEIVCQISDEQLAQLQEKKKTGYERVGKREWYYMIDGNGAVEEMEEEYVVTDTTFFETANYYSDETLAENDARFYELHRKLKRFAVENRENELDWGNGEQSKYYIYYSYYSKKLTIGSLTTNKDFSQILFDSRETAEKAIELFKYELIWYFAEFKDSL